MDITETLAPKSDQLNAEDLLTGPRTVTVEKVTKGSVEQPVDIHLVEFPGRPFKPSKTVRRILVAAWGAEASKYTGRRMTLYRDPEVRFGGMEVGGIRVSHLSHIQKRITIALTVSKGRRAPYVVDPLPDAPPPQQQPSNGAAQQLGRRMNDLFIKADIAKDNREDRLIVARSIVGLPDLQSASDLTPEHLAALVDQLEKWYKAGTLAEKTTDILQADAVARADAAEAAAQQESEK